MNILFLSHYFPPEVNAPATRTYEHCKRWVELGNNVTVVTCAPNCPDGVVYDGYKNKHTVETIDGIKVIRVRTYLAPNKGFLKRIFNYLSYMFGALFHSITMRNVDVVIATSPQFFCGWAGVLLKYLRKWPFILEIRDIWPESIVTVGAMRKSKIIRFLEILEKKMYKAADHIVAVGEGYKKKIMEKDIDSDKISVIINGVDLKKFNNENISGDKIRNRYNAPDKFVCSYIGTVGMAHGLEVVLKAASVLKSKNDNSVQFWIVGDGAERSRLQSSAQKQNLDNIIFTGRLPKEDMPSVIAASDASLVHLRGTELFGTVIPSKIFELMAMNVPIIMGVKGEAQDIVLRGNAGVVMEPDDEGSLVSCIESIVSRNTHKFNGKEYVTLYFDRIMLANEMLKIIRVNTNNCNKKSN
ncbi:glycosyl transferase, group 1 [Chitinispirillum alkaliphilum]|nr:glycosyl transferase, group 1 [Chitinispirillum alkaliphilum]